ncbi:hypothetical protein AB0H76_15195 [Nocardia sp. NPDC050712]|uniref:hypothetical protein n=1 Tax=Nocardia sp. NPDC050712 TaxID=3155518 RepID=UPI0033FEEC9E
MSFQRDEEAREARLEVTFGRLILARVAEAYAVDEEARRADTRLLDSVALTDSRLGSSPRQFLAVDVTLGDLH